MDTEAVTVTNPYNDPKFTLREHCDRQIAEARQRVEDLTIKKAKLETLNMLDYPYNQLRTLLDFFPF